jgi:hypothetical protein
MSGRVAAGGRQFLGWSAETLLYLGHAHAAAGKIGAFAGIRATMMASVLFDSCRIERVGVGQRG